MTVSAEDYTKLIAQQHKSNPKFMETLRGFCESAAHVNNVTTALISAFDIDNAVGDQLDILAEWIGLGRGIPVPIEGFYFELGDAVNPTITGLGYGQWKQEYDTTTKMEFMNDEMFRNVLKSKILANHWTGNHNGAYEIARAALGLSVGIKITDQPAGTPASAAATVGNDINITDTTTPEKQYPNTLGNSLAISANPAVGVPYYSTTLDNDLAYRVSTATEKRYYYAATYGKKICYYRYSPGGFDHDKLYNGYSLFRSSDYGDTVVWLDGSETYSPENTFISNTSFPTYSFMDVTTVIGSEPANHTEKEGGQWALLDRGQHVGSTGGDKYFTTEDAYFGGTSPNALNKTLILLDVTGTEVCRVSMLRARDSLSVQGTVLSGTLPSSPITGGKWAFSTDTLTTPSAGAYFLEPASAYFELANVGDTINIMNAAGVSQATFEIEDFVSSTKVAATLISGSVPSSPVTAGLWDWDTVTAQEIGIYTITADASYFGSVTPGIDQVTLFDLESDPTAIFDIYKGVSATVIEVDLASGTMPTLPIEITGGAWKKTGDTITYVPTRVPQMRVTITGATELQEALFDQEIIPLKPSGVTISYVFI